MRQSRRGLFYLEGGNPPHLPGLYLDRRLIVIWPIDIEPTEERALNIFRLWEANQLRSGEVFGRERVREELTAAGLI